MVLLEVWDDDNRTRAYWRQKVGWTGGMRAHKLLRLYFLLTAPLQIGMACYLFLAHTEAYDRVDTSGAGADGGTNHNPNEERLLLNLRLATLVLAMSIVLCTALALLAVTSVSFDAKKQKLALMRTVQVLSLLANILSPGDPREPAVEMVGRVMTFVQFVTLAVICERLLMLQSVDYCQGAIFARAPVDAGAALGVKNETKIFDIGQWISQGDGSHQGNRERKAVAKKAADAWTSANRHHEGWEFSNHLSGKAAKEWATTNNKEEEWKNTEKWKNTALETDFWKGSSLCTFHRGSDRSAQDVVHHLDLYLEVMAVRKKIIGHLKIGRSETVGLVKWLSVFFMLNFFASMGFVGTNLTGELLEVESSEFLNAMRTDLGSPLLNFTYGGAGFHNPPGDRWMKVVVVVLDGLRNDHVLQGGANSHPAFKELFDDMGEDYVHVPMQCSLPSMSVPNWLTLVTGAPPELTGAMGNVGIPETNYDSIFRRVSEAGRSSALTGSPWFANIVLSAIEGHQFGGTDTAAHPKGTVPTNFGAVEAGQDPASSADAADDKRADIAVAAIKSDAYDLFLVHFSDIDIQGHNFGVTRDWNKGNTYNSAITNKTAHVRRIMEAADNNTVVILTADHGHSERDRNSL